MANSQLQLPAVVTGSGGSLAQTFGASCTAGSTIVALVLHRNQAQAVSVTDPTNGAYAQAVAGAASSDGTGRGSARWFCVHNTGTTALTVTATLTGNTDGCVLQLWEIAGPASTGKIGATATAFGINSPPSTPSLPITTSFANSTILCASTHYPSGAVVDTGFTASFTEDNSIGSGYCFGQHLYDAGVAGTRTLSEGFTSDSDGWVMAAFELKTDAGGGSPVLAAIPNAQRNRRSRGRYM